MRRFFIFALVIAVAISAGAAHKKSSAPKAPASPAKKSGEVFRGALSKVTVKGKDDYSLKSDAGDKIELSYAAAKKMSINLDDFVGQRIVVTGQRDPKSKVVTTIVAVTTEEDYKKQHGN